MTSRPAAGAKRSNVPSKESGWGCPLAGTPTGFSRRMMPQKTKLIGSLHRNLRRFPRRIVHFADRG